METTAQTDKNIPNNKLIIVHKNKKKLTYPAHLGNINIIREKLIRSPHKKRP